MNSCLIGSVRIENILTTKFCCCGIFVTMTFIYYSHVFKQAHMLIVYIMYIMNVYILYIYIHDVYIACSFIKTHTYIYT